MEDKSRHGGYHIDQRGCVVERRLSPARSTNKNCQKCVYHTPIGNELVCRRLELPNDVKTCRGKIRYFVEVKDATEET